MTDLAGALTQTTHLSDFEGKQVRQVGIVIPGVAGGLRDAIKIDPQEFRQGTRVFVAIECIVHKVKHEPVDDDEPAGDQRRVHVFKTVTATIVDEKVVGAQIERQRELIKRAQAAAGGYDRLNTGDELAIKHEEGEHTDAIAEGCPLCEEAWESSATKAPEGTTPIGRGGRKKA